MIYDIIFNACCIALALIIVYFWLWKPLRRERFENRVTDCRDRLFDYWYDHDLPMDNHAYAQAMELCDLVHEKAPRLTSWAVLSALRADRAEEPEREEALRRIRDSIEELPPPARGRLMFTFFSVLDLTVRRILWGNPLIGMAIYLPFWASWPRRKMGDFVSFVREIRDNPDDPLQDTLGLVRSI